MYYVDLVFEYMYAWNGVSVVLSSTAFDTSLVPQAGRFLRNVVFNISMGGVATYVASYTIAARLDEQQLQLCDDYRSIEAMLYRPTVM